MSPLIVILLLAAAALLWAHLGPGASRASTRRCSRCWRAVPRLQPYVDGRREYWVCAMCASEMDFVNAAHIDIPRG